MAFTGPTIAEQIAEAEKKLAQANDQTPEPGSQEESDALEAAAMEVSEPAAEEPKDDDALAAKVEDQLLNNLVQKRDALTLELNEKIKAETALNAQIRELKISKAVDLGMFNEASWAMDVDKKDGYIILYSILSRHTKLTKYLAPRLVNGLCTIAFDDLLLQFTATQILLFAYKDDEALIDWVKEHKIKINIGMCAEAAGVHRRLYNELMTAIRAFKDQDGTNVEDRRDEALKAIKPEMPIRKADGQVNTIKDDGTEWGPPYSEQDCDGLPPA